MGKKYKPVIYLNTKETATPISKPEDINNIKLHEWFTFNCIVCSAKATIAKRSDKGRIERLVSFIVTRWELTHLVYFYFTINAKCIL